MRHAVIMAGGSGTRLWPVSRAQQPKQLVPLIPDNQSDGTGKPISLLQVAANRLEGLVDAPRRFICTGERYRDQIKASLPAFTDAQILGEPIGRDTVNAVGFAAAVLHKQDPHAVFSVLTADHLIEPVEVFQSRMALGYQIAEQSPNTLVTFSVKPTYPATGFGYVEQGDAIEGTNNLAFAVERFVEKPNAEKAQAFIESGNFAWNSGMFVWKAATVLDCLRRYKPESYEGLMKIADAWGTDHQETVLNEIYPTLPKISVDYAILEPASREQQRAAAARDDTGVRIATVVMDLNWLDVGSWPSFGETLTPDAQGNLVAAPQGSVSLEQSEGALVVNHDDSHHVAVLGGKDLIVIHTKGATLVMERDKAQDLKNLHAKLPDSLK